MGFVKTIFKQNIGQQLMKTVQEYLQKHAKLANNYKMGGNEQKSIINMLNMSWFAYIS